MAEPVVDVANAGIVPRTDYKNVLEGILADGSCPFCEEHLSQYHSEPIVWKSDSWIVTKNAWPYPGAEHHFLLISRRHVDRIEHLRADEIATFFEDYRRLVNEYELVGATVLWRSGDGQYTGASVSHLHAHVIVGHPRSPTCQLLTGLVGFGPSE